jgi:hypothetical protein
MTFASLLYRYWFFGWLFRDASRGNALERDSALRYNVERARWLPTYMARWTLLGLAMYALGGGLEFAGLNVVATIAFLPVCLAAAVLAVASAAWWTLRGPGSAYARLPTSSSQRR